MYPYTDMFMFWTFSVLHFLLFFGGGVVKIIPEGHFLWEIQTF